MPTDKPRYSITLDEDMFREIEDFRFENRFANRNQATIALIRLGLEAVKKDRTEAYRMKKETEKNSKNLK